MANPHPPFPAPDLSPRTSICDLGCIERFTPSRLRSVELFKKIDYLSCLQDNYWTDEEMRTYLGGLSDFFRKSLSGGLQLLNWYSLVRWVEVNSNNWGDTSIFRGFGNNSADFYSRYDLSTEDIWLSMSIVNGSDVNKQGFKYFDWMLRPYVGTNLIQRKIIEKLQINGEIVDWYNSKGIVNSYSIVMNDFPGWEKAKILIINSKLLKNAESILISIKDSRCPSRFLLSDGGTLDRNSLSDIVTDSFEGVFICFRHSFSKKVDFSKLFSNNVKKTFNSLKELNIDYFSSRMMSDNTELDGKTDRIIFSTKTNFWPTKNIQLLPAYHGDPNTWNLNTTWQDHYLWGNIEITNLVRTILPDASSFSGRGWDKTVTWERWSDWKGEQNTSWNYNKPNVSGVDYFEKKNYIPGFEPSTGNSLYRAIVYSKKSKIQVSSILNNRNKIIYFWDDFLLSSNESISPLDTQLKKTKFIVVKHTSI